MSWLAWSLVIFLTALAAILGPAWWMGRRERVPASPPPLPSTMTHALPRAGRLDLVAAHICSICGGSWDTPDTRCPCSRAFAGAADPAQQLQPFDPLLVLADALTIAERWQARDQVSLEVAAIIAEVEANPDQWRHR